MGLTDQLTEALVGAVEETFSVTLSLNPSIVGNETIPGDEQGLICSIGITGSVDGNLNIYLTEKNASQIVAKMLGMEIEEGSADAIDGMGEVLNMVAGGVKGKIASTGETFEISIPQVIKGSHLSIKYPEDSIVIEKSYMCEDITFKVLFNYQVHDEFKEAPQKEDTPKMSALEMLQNAIKDKGDG